MTSPAGTEPRRSGPSPRRLASLRAWFDSSTTVAPSGGGEGSCVDWLRAVPFLALHAGCLLVLWNGVSATALGVAAATYGARMFAITAFYHRGLSHRAFRCGRVTQFAFAFLAASSAQRGPLWWAAHHRAHHRRSDRSGDAHSPWEHGFLWSHTGWFLSRENFRTRLREVPDLARFPELRWLDRFDVVAPLSLLLALLALGAVLERFVPSAGTNAAQLVAWGFFVSTVALAHATFTINSLAHRFGRRRFDTPDQSRNNAWLALPTFGEGWHNNHHHHPHSARQGFRWFEIDLSYYGLAILARLGLVRDLRPVPERLRR